MDIKQLIEDWLNSGNQEETNLDYKKDYEEMLEMLEKSYKTNQISKESYEKAKKMFESKDFKGFTNLTS